MIKYKQKATHLNPGFTYLFEWKEGLNFEGIYIRSHSKKKNVFLFKLIKKDEYAPVYVPEDPTLSECVWVNENSFSEIKEIYEVNKPDFVKPKFDKKEEFAAALVYDALPMHGLDCCPKCGKSGQMIKMAIVCPQHGVYGGC